MPKKPTTYLGFVEDAILSLEEAEGSSRQAIAKHIKAAFGKEDAPALKRALKAGVAKGVLERCGARFKKVGVEFASTKPTVEVEDLRDGEGPFARSGDTVEMTYEGTLADTGERFDGGEGFTFTIDGGEVIKGWDQGVKGMRLGGKRRLRVPSALGYGRVRLRPCMASRSVRRQGLTSGTHAARVSPGDTAERGPRLRPHADWRALHRGGPVSASKDRRRGRLAYAHPAGKKSSSRSMICFIILVELRRTTRLAAGGLMASSSFSFGFGFGFRRRRAWRCCSRCAATARRRVWMAATRVATILVAWVAGGCLLLLAWAACFCRFASTDFLTLSEHGSSADEPRHGS